MMAALTQSPETIAVPANGVASHSVSRQDAPRRFRWSSELYHRLSEESWFQDRRVELIEGEIIEMTAMNGPHWTACKLVEQVLEAAFSTDYVVTMQLPIKLADGSEPQPDVMVVTGTVRDYSQNIPTTAVLVVEVSVSTLNYDRSDKASLYAKAELQEYWLLNVEARQLEVHRRPMPMSEQPFGFGYAERLIFMESESVAPLAAPDSLVAVQELLP